MDINVQMYFKYILNTLKVSMFHLQKKTLHFKGIMYMNVCKNVFFSMDNILQLKHDDHIKTLTCFLEEYNIAVIMILCD